MDYRKCRTDIGFWVRFFAWSAGIGVLAAALFYNSPWGLLTAPATAPFVWRYMRAEQSDRQKKELKAEFGEVMALVSGNLQAGYSLEQAFAQVQKTGGTKYRLMSRELSRIVNGLGCGERLEELLLDLGERSGISEVLDFAKMVETAKKFGGNIPQLIRQMTTGFAEAEAVEAEIDTAIAAKRLEGIIMLVVPFGILGYFRVFDPSYTAVLYETPGGRIWMTFSLLVVGLCAMWIGRIIRIEV